MILSGLLTRIAGRTEEAVGLDIGSGSVKMAEVVERRGKPFLKKMSIFDLPPGAVENGLIADEALLADAMQRMASRNGFSGNRVAVALGGRSLFIREVLFPRMTTTELRQAIRWDLDKYVPFSPDQLYFDFWVTGPGTTEFEVRVLLVAVPRDVVDSMLRVLKRAGFKTVAVDIEPLAIQRTLPETAECMLIDCGSSVSQVTLFQNHSPVFTRSIPIGGNQFTEMMMDGLEIGREEADLVKKKAELLREAPETSGGHAALQEQVERMILELAGEVRRTLEYYQVQNRNVNISKVYITGGGAKLEQLPERLSQILELPVYLHDPLVGLEMSSSYSRQYARGVGPQMAVAVGLALRGIEE